MFDLSRMKTLALGGAIGGLVAFVLVNPFVRGKALLTAGAAARNWLQVGPIFGSVVGLTIGASLIAAEEWHTHSSSRILRRSLLGALAGAICGAVGGVDGEFTFAVFNAVNVVVARCVGWAFMGAAAGVCPGLVSRSRKCAELGAIGGLLGGAVGGLLFDVVALICGSMA